MHSSEHGETGATGAKEPFEEGVGLVAWIL